MIKVRFYQLTALVLSGATILIIASPMIVVICFVAWRLRGV